MDRTLLRRLIVGNAAVYAVVAALIVAANLFPAEANVGGATQGSYFTAAPLISIMLPTPTPLAIEAAHAIPIATIVPHETPIPVTPMPRGSGANAPARVQRVRDQGLVPPTALNILLMGTDRRPGAPNWRTDTMILVSVNQAERTVGMLTIPRDLYVDIPGIGYQRINTADFYGEYYKFPGGGPNLIKQTIEKNLGIRVHYYVRGGFEGFRKAVDILGGIDVDVDCALYEQDFYDDYGHATLNFVPGVQQMDGITALRYARSRYTTNDYDRGRRQRKVLLAMWDKATSLDLLPKWPQLYEQLRDSIQTDLGPVEMAGLAYLGTQLQMDKIKSRAIDNRVAVPYITQEGAWVLLPNAEKLHSLLVDFFAPPTEEQDEVQLEAARVQIVSGDPKTAEIASVYLRRQGINTTFGDAPAMPSGSTITVFGPKPATARRLASLLRLDPSIIQTSISANPNFDIVVNLGRDYRACQR